MIQKLINIIQSLFWRPPVLQVAALCYREENGVTEVLLVKSLDRGRWILPKGWPMRGKTLPEAAAIEAWEEAGVKGRILPEPKGSYHYVKRQRGGVKQPCQAMVYEIAVEFLAETYPESGRRRRQWFLPEVASTKVEEPELSAILQRFKAELPDSAL